MAKSDISLSDFVSDLRRELAKAHKKGKNLEPKLRVEEAEVELQIALTREGTGGGSVKFWVFNAEAKGKLANVTTQKIKLKLKPINPDGTDFEMSDTE